MSNDRWEDKDDDSSFLNIFLLSPFSSFFKKYPDLYFKFILFLPIEALSIVCMYNFEKSINSHVSLVLNLLLYNHFTLIIMFVITIVVIKL